MARDLAKMECVPCQGGIPPLKGAELQSFYQDLNNGWEVVEEHHLKKRFKFPEFKSALGFVNKVGALAEEIGHHPEITFGWGFAEIQVYTHKINGLHEADFVFAAKTDQLLG